MSDKTKTIGGIEMSNFDGIYGLCVGNKIGEGFSREVYQWYPDDSLVLKVAIGYRGIKSNIKEFDLWENVISGSFYEGVKLWLAPVEVISECGRFMLMKKTEPVRFEDAPTVIPTWMTDIKLSNIGWYEGRIVSHDYAINLMVEDALSKSKHKAKIINKDKWKI